MFGFLRNKKPQFKLDPDRIYPLPENAAFNMLNLQTPSLVLDCSEGVIYEKLFSKHNEAVGMRPLHHLGFSNFNNNAKEKDSPYSNLDTPISDSVECEWNSLSDWWFDHEELFEEKTFDKEEFREVGGTSSFSL